MKKEALSRGGGETVSLVAGGDAEARVGGGGGGDGDCLPEMLTSSPRARISWSMSLVDVA